ncbi:MAG: hypothetical protein ACK5C5_04675 [Bacteroidota bacterium]|jgi:membrane-bound metal-dependent hydrolase YbcI (DUF457 family)
MKKPNTILVCSVLVAVYFLSMVTLTFNNQSVAVSVIRELTAIPMLLFLLVLFFFTVFAFIRTFRDFQWKLLLAFILQALAAYTMFNPEKFII